MTRLQETLRHARERGYTLVELLVAMAIFTVLLMVVVAAVNTMMIDTRKASAVSDAADQARHAFDRLDKQLRYADAVDSPTESGQDWYLRFETYDAGGSLLCRQWRLVASSDLLQQRSWAAPGPPTPLPAWSTVATGVVNNPATQQPFTWTSAGSQTPMQQVAVQLVVSRGVHPTAQAETKTTFIARNTTQQTVTNDANGDGVSDTMVCTP